MRLKNLTAIALCLALAFSISIPHAYARFINTESVDAILIFNGDLAKCEGRVFGLSGTSHIAISLSLERKNENGTYTTVKSWPVESKKSTCFSLNKNFFVSTGYTYRTYVYAEVTRNGTVEEVEAWSDPTWCG